MVAERQDKRPTTDSQKELVVESLHTQITNLIRTHVPEPKPDYSLISKPVIVVQLPTENNGTKRIIITGTNYPWSDSDAPTNNSYTIEDPSSGQQFSIHTNKVTTATDPEGKKPKKNIEYIARLLAKIVDPKAKIGGGIEKENPAWGYV